MNGRSALKAVAETEDQEPEIQRRDEEGQHPAKSPDPDRIHKFPHDPAASGELHQRDDGKAELHAQDDLAEEEKVSDRLFPGEGDHDDRRNDR